MTLVSFQKSTIVRVTTTIQLATIRAAFGTLERAAPAVGAWWAERLWLTFPRYRGTRRVDTLPPGETFRVAVRSRNVAGRAWGKGPTVYLVHGWGGAGVQLDAFVPPLLAAGHRVVSFDALSHGDSEPGRLGARRTTIPEMADALTAVMAEHGPARAVIAHSIGSAATFFALRHGITADRLVFLAPMTQPTPYTVLFGAMLGFDERIRTRMQARVARRVGVPWSDFDVPSQVEQGRVVTPPLLLVHDPRDRETRYADSLAVTSVWPGAELLTVNDLGHWRILRDPETVSRVVTFVADTGQAAGERYRAS